MLIAEALSEHRRRSTAHWENQKTLKNGEGWMGARMVLTTLKRYKVGLKDPLVKGRSYKLNY